MTDRPTAFFALTFLLAVPFYVLNALAYLDILGGPGLGPLYIALFTVTPIASASLLTLRERRSEGLRQLLLRIFDFKKIGDRRWYAVILLSPLLISLLYIGGFALSAAQLPPPSLPFATLPVVVLFFFVLAAGEEAGWMGYAYEPMQAQAGALRAALGLGVVWAFWHVPFFVFMMPVPIVFGTQFLTLVGTRVLIAWVYINAGKSVFSAILFHAMSNALMVTLPGSSALEPAGSAVYCGLVLLAATIVTFLWGSPTLARYRFGKRPAMHSGG